jgi:hypothetical protein
MMQREDFAGTMKEMFWQLDLPHPELVRLKRRLVEAYQSQMVGKPPTDPVLLWPFGALAWERLADGREEYDLRGTMERLEALVSLDDAELIRAARKVQKRGGSDE